MNQKVKVVTWKMAPNRYLHEVITERGFFHIVTDSYYFSLRSFTLRNKVLSRRITKEIRGLKKVMEEREEWIGDDSWTILCFGGNDNLELRKKIYGKELKKIKLELQIYPRSGRVDMIIKDGGEDLIPGRSVLLRRNLRKRIKDPLPYIILQQQAADLGERPVRRFYFVSELSFIQFNQKLERWYR
jgi:hypothetical protein